MKKLLKRGRWGLIPVLYLMMTAAGVQADKTERIFGGAKTQSEWSYMAGIFEKSKPNGYSAQFCGGTLISDTWVVTAAHCFEMIEDNTQKKITYKRYDDANVAVGSANLETALRQDIRRVIIHPKFDAFSLENDIALIELSQAVDNDPLPVYSGTGPLDNENAVILGWGLLETGTYPQDLYEATVTIPSNPDCNRAFRSHQAYSYFPITDQMICAGDPVNWNVDTCEGDSGGPLIVTLAGEAKLAGITSWGESCAEDNLYGVYTRVSEYTGFIAEATISATVRGTVTALNDIGESIPLKGATVTVVDSDVNDETDENGRYSVSVSAGDHSVWVSSSQYGRKKTTVSAATGEIVTFSPQLTWDINPQLIGNEESTDSVCFIQSALGS